MFGIGGKIVKRKREEDYLPIHFAKNFIEDPEAFYFDDILECDRHYQGLDSVKKYGAKDSERLQLARTAFIAADWLRYKQAYRITKELAHDLFQMEDLSFPAGALKLPFRTIYLDLEELNISAKGDGSVQNAVLGGILLTYGNVNAGEETAGFCGFTTLIQVPGEKNCQFGGISFPIDDKCNGEELGSFIDENTEEFLEIRPYLKMALLFAAYLSSEKPDISENEKQKQFYRPSTKVKTSAVRKWDVGIRYAKEVQTAKAIPISSRTTHHSGKSPRPHIRKAHWHIYRVGKGRKETKVLWLPPIEVGCSHGNLNELPTVVRSIS